MILPNLSTLTLQHIIELLTQQELVALPTETVYGLAGLATSEKALHKIYNAKQRPLTNPLIVHTHHQTLEPLYAKNILAPQEREQASIAQALMKCFWPGPLTLLLPKGSYIPALASAGSTLVGIRCPNHPDILKILQTLDMPLCAPSANPFGRVSPTSAEMVEHYFPHIATLDGGVCTIGIESTIIQMTAEKDPAELNIIRAGAISLAAIQTALKNYHVRITHTTPYARTTKAIQTTGSFHRHYQPKKALYLLRKTFSEFDPSDWSSMLQYFKNTPITMICFSTTEQDSTKRAITEHAPNLGVCDYQSLSPSKTLEWNIITKNFFHTLHTIDQSSQSACIIFHKPPIASYENPSLAIMDKLQRAKKTINTPWCY